jgi:hypothetical protein
MATEIELFESTDLTPLYFCLWGWITSEICKRKAVTRDQLFARILNSAACVKKCEDWLRRTRCDLRTGANTLRLTVGFSKIYSALSQICHLNIKLKKINEQ